MESPPDPQEKVSSPTEPSAEEISSRRIPNALTFRLEHLPDQFEPVPGIPRSSPIKNWNRVFEVSDKITLEQFAAIIVVLLGWEKDHLYEFHIDNTIYIHMGDPHYTDFVVDAPSHCVSCAIRLRHLSLTPGSDFDFIFDFGRWHQFRLTLLSDSPHYAIRALPSLISHQGKNIVQYPELISRKERKLIEKAAPTLKPPSPCIDTASLIRFVRTKDRDTLLEWRASNNKKLWQKAVTILENRNMSIEEISKKIEKSTDVVMKWILEFNCRGIAGLNPERKPRTPGDREAAADRRKKRIIDIIHDRPISFGINRASWNLTSLAKAYTDTYGESISRSTVGTIIRNADYSIKKARRVLTSPDPRYREKVELVLSTLQNLKPDELFFFIDELGPLGVKKYGGRMFTSKDDVPTVPQLQAHKGSITMAGALSATANQVTWLFSPAKDTQSMIDLIEILFNQHPAAKRIFITWDAASWHSSASLIEWLDTFNAQTLDAGFGPTIQFVPLPVSSQFLDVLEAVFSGMKRAVVHHSDYQSVTELKTAVSNHFVDRNAFFKENPKRAGKKIWDVDFFQDSNNLLSGNYREW